MLAALETMEVQQLQVIGEIIEIHVLAQRQIPMVQTMQKTQTYSTVATQ